MEIEASEDQFLIVLCSIVVARCENVASGYSDPKSFLVEEEFVQALLGVVLELLFNLIILSGSPPSSNNSPLFDLSGRFNPRYPAQIFVVHKIFQNPHMQGLLVVYDY